MITVTFYQKILLFVEFIFIPQQIPFLIYIKLFTYL